MTRADALRAKRARAVATGMCSRCFGRAARPGMAECATCGSWGRRKRRMTPEQLQAARDRNRRWKQQQKAVRS